jgi:hypothetical protein
VAELAFLRQLRHSALLLRTAEALRDALLQQSEARAAWSTAAAAATQTAGRLQAAVDAQLGSLREVQSRKAALESQVGGLREAIEGIDAKLPQLTEEKKLAVGERKFKEAGRLTAELKRLGDQREEAARELSGCLSGVDDCEARVGEVTAEIEAARGRLAAHEREADAARMEGLRAALRAMRRAVRRIGRLTAKQARPAVARPGAAASPAASPAAAAGAELASQAVLEAVPEADLVAGLPSGAAPAPVSQPADAELGIEVEAGSGKTAAQAAALDLLQAERELMLEELNALAGKHGTDMDLGEETASEGEEEQQEAKVEAEVALAPSPAAAEVASPAAAAAAVASPASAGASPSSPPPASAQPSAGAVVIGEEEDEHTAGSAVAVAVDAQRHGAQEEQGEEGASSASEEAIRAAVAAAMGGELHASPLGEEATASAEPSAAPEAAGGAGGDPAAEARRAEAERCAELRTLKRAYLSALAAVREKEEVIADAVGREDYDTADQAQADIDACADHKAFLLERAAEHGVGSEEELLAVDLDAADGEGQGAAAAGSGNAGSDAAAGAAAGAGGHGSEVEASAPASHGAGAGAVVEGAPATQHASSDAAPKPAEKHAKESEEQEMDTQEDVSVVALPVPASTGFSFLAAAAPAADSLVAPVADAGASSATVLSPESTGFSFLAPAAAATSPVDDGQLAAGAPASASMFGLPVVATGNAAAFSSDAASPVPSTGFSFLIGAATAAPSATATAPLEAAEASESAASPGAAAVDGEPTAE